MTSRTTSRTIRTIQIRSPPKGGLLMARVLMVLEVVLVVLEVTPNTIERGPTYPIFCAVKATILGHILAPF